jgi:hypothetical protein
MQIPPANDRTGGFTMETIMKRLVAAAFAAMLIVFGGSSLNVNAAPAGYYQDQKVVYHNDGGGPDTSAYFKRMLNSIKNHIAAVGKDHVEIRVVDHGIGVDLFQAAKTDIWPTGLTRCAPTACASSSAPTR